MTSITYYSAIVTVRFTATSFFKGGGAPSGPATGRKFDAGTASVENARRELTKTREQLEEEKKISLSIRIKPLDVDSLDSEQLKNKAGELWDTIIRLETEKYDLEARQDRQNYDVSSTSMLRNAII